MLGRRLRRRSQDFRQIERDLTRGPGECATGDGRRGGRCANERCAASGTDGGSLDGALLGGERGPGEADRVQGGRQEDRCAEGLGCGGQLRRGYVRWRHEEENPVTSPVCGVGLGLRWDFVDELIQKGSALGDARSRALSSSVFPIDFFEITPENYVRRGGSAAAALEWVADRFPIVTHGLTLSLGGLDPLDQRYLGELAAVLDRVGAPWHSDHLCFCEAGGRVLHELLPVAFTRSNVTRIADRIRRARDAIQRPLAVENVSYYWHPGRADLSEPEFLSSVCHEADCSLLLDVNNAYVNACNFGFDVDAWMRAAPLERVVEIHVAGHEWFAVDDRGLGDRQSAGSTGAMIVDTHGAAVPPPVLGLLRRVLVRTGPVPIVLERDQNVPPLDELFDELTRIRTMWRSFEASDATTDGARTELGHLQT